MSRLARAFVDELFFRLISTEQSPGPSGVEIPLTFFDGAELLTCASQNAGEILSGRRVGYADPVHLSCSSLKQPLDICSVTNALEDPHTLQFLRFKLVGVRPGGKIEPDLLFVEQTGAYLGGYGHYWVYQLHLVGAHDSWDSWSYTTHESQTLMEAPPDILRPLQMAVSVQYTRESLWTVCFGDEQAPTLAFTTDAQGAMAALGIQQAQTRCEQQERIWSWLKLHWRRNRQGRRDEALKYFDRPKNYNWRSMRCQIIPPQLTQSMPKPRTNTTSFAVC